MSSDLKPILAAVVPSLRATGDKGSGQNYRLASDKVVSVVNFQKSVGGKVFYVNVGVHPLFVPTVVAAQPDAKKIKEPECIFRTRLDPPSDDLSGWPYTIDLADEFVQRFDELYRDYIAPLMVIPGPITDARVADFASDTVHPILGARHAITFLHFAEISLAMDDRDRAVEFAREAIEICPPDASRLLGHLQQLLSDASGP